MRSYLAPVSRPTSQQIAPPTCSAEQRLNVRSDFPSLLHVVGIAGTGSNSGKTTFAEALILALAQQGLPVAALKVTRAHDGECPIGDSSCLVCSTAGSSFRIVSDARTLAMRGKDTGRYVEAGATQVRWLVTNPQSVATGMRAVLAHFTNPCILVAEGNSFCDFVAVDQLLMVCGANTPKPSTAVLLPRVSTFVDAGGTLADVHAPMPMPAQAALLTMPAALEAVVRATPTEVLARLRGEL